MGLWALTVKFFVFFVILWCFFHLVCKDVLPPVVWVCLHKDWHPPFLTVSLRFVLDHRLWLFFFWFWDKIISVEALVSLVLCKNFFPALNEIFRTFHLVTSVFFTTYEVKNFNHILRFVFQLKMSGLSHCGPLALLERQPSRGHRLVLVTPWEGEQFREDRKWGGGANERASWEAQQNAENQIWHASV